MENIELPELSDRNTISDNTLDEPYEPDRQVQTSNYKVRFLFMVGFVILILAIGTMHWYELKLSPKSSPFQKDVEQHKQREQLETPHDTQCYTQGLSFINQTHILESCGLFDKSYFHILELNNFNNNKNNIVQIYSSPKFKQFLEGSCLFPKNNLIYILTWKQNIVFRYDLGNLGRVVDQLRWPMQGWGLTHNNTHLIISDGSSNLYITNENLTILETISVKDVNNTSVSLLNELEWVEEKDVQYIFANVYQSTRIVKIELKTGRVVLQTNLNDLVQKERRQGHEQVLNGIAYHIATKKFIITGKQWGSFYILNHLER